MTFVLKKLDKAKTATYKITIQATSAKTGLKSSSVLTIAFTVQPPALGKGQSKKKKSRCSLVERPCPLYAAKHVAHVHFYVLEAPGTGCT